ncbi:unnamed protein product [Rhizopus stolonifer]
MLRHTTPSIRSFSTAPVVLAGRQLGRKKPAIKYNVDDMPKFEFDNQTTLGHLLFDNIREVLYAKPFEAPGADQILKFKTHSYLGEGHPVERKVVLSVKVSDLKLNDTEKHKFLLLSGPRYNVNTEEFVMSSEKFPKRQQNKKFLIDTLNKLVNEAKDAKDTFADVPLNLPKPKTRLEFPKEWLKPKEQSSSAQ